MAIGYYTNEVTIPTHVPDGEYVLGWTWYGGVSGSELANTNTAKPGNWGYYGVYWSCSWIEIKGGAPVTASYSPVFVNELTQFSEDGCAASTNRIDQCVVEPCNLQTKAQFMKPVEFKNGPPTPLTSSMYGASIPADEPVAEASPIAAATPESVPVATTTPEPQISGSDEGEDDDMKEGQDLYLQVFAAGLAFSDRKAGPVLDNGTKVCPSDYASGMTIVCRGVGKKAETATFYENGVLKRTERKYPYAIGSDDGAGRFGAWTPSELTEDGRTEVRCETGSGGSVSVSIYVTCTGRNMYVK